jgi:hypothetical protein
VFSKEDSHDDEAKGVRKYVNPGITAGASSSGAPVPVIEGWEVSGESFEVGSDMRVEVLDAPNGMEWAIKLVKSTTSVVNSLYDSGPRIKFRGDAGWDLDIMG